MTTEFASADNAPRRDGSALSEGLGHTPGPWTVAPGFPAVESPRAPNLALCNDHAIPMGERMANAKLIAAAPKLGHALRDLVDVMTGRMDGETVALHNAVAALRDAGLVA